VGNPPSAALRAYVDEHHQPGEAYTTPVDYGTGLEHGLACICGADWGEDSRNDGCEERLALLAIADQIDAANAVRTHVEADRDALRAVVDRIKAKCSDMKEPGTSFFDPYAAIVIEKLIDGDGAPANVEDLDRREFAHRRWLAERDAWARTRVAEEIASYCDGRVRAFGDQLAAGVLPEHSTAVRAAWDAAARVARQHAAAPMTDLSNSDDKRCA
jgi:hypothetical protein